MWMHEEGIDARFLLRDRDTKFAPAFDKIFTGSSTRIVKAPDANAYAESWVGSLKRECLDHFLCFSRRHLDHILSEYVRYYNRHRPHQGLGNRTVSAALGNNPPPTEQIESDPIRCQRFLGGLLRHYYRAAA